MREKVVDRKIIGGFLHEKEDGVYDDELEGQAKMTEGPK